jgi:hypothetical protein
MQSLNLSTVGQSLDGTEVVWNGAIERQAAVAAQRPAPPLRPVTTVAGPGQPRAVEDDTSRRPGDRILTYLLANPYAVHDSKSVSEALGMAQNNVSNWLTRFRLSGVLEIEYLPVDRREMRRYRVRLGGK